MRNPTSYKNLTLRRVINKFSENAGVQLILFDYLFPVSRQSLAHYSWFYLFEENHLNEAVKMHAVFECALNAMVMQSKLRWR